MNHHALLRRHTLVALAIGLMTFTSLAACKKKNTPAAEKVAAAKANASGEVTFTRKPVPTNMPVTESSNTHMVIKTDIMIHGKVVHTMQMDRTEKINETRTILARVGGAMTKLRIKYLVKQTKTAKMKHAKPSPVTGKTFTAGVKGGKVVITGKSGKPASQAEASIVLSDIRDLGATDALAKFLASRKFKKGKSVNMSAKVAGQVFQLDDPSQGMMVRKCAITLEDVKVKAGKEVAEMATDIVVKGRASGTHIDTSMPVKGTMWVQVDTGWPVSFEMHGPISLNGAVHHGRATTVIKGTGKLTVTAHDTY